MTVAAVVLAAGAGSRLGRPKAGLLIDGVTFADRAVATARSGGCDPVILVVGAEPAPATDADLVVINARWATGMGSSLLAGLEAANASGADAVVVLLVDQPGIGDEAVRRLVAAHGRGARLARATYDGRPDHPVLLAREHWAGLAVGASGDAGARTYLRAHAEEVTLVPCDGCGDPRDVDTPDDLQAIGGTEPV